MRKTMGGAACVGLVALSLTGCASWAKHGIAPHPPDKIKVVVLPIQIAVKIKHLRSIETAPKTALPAERELIDRRLRQAREDITRDFEIRLISSYFFEVIADSDVRQALEARGLASSTATLTAAQLQDLGRSLGAQVVLATKLSGYGAVKKRWLFYLIGSGLVEGLAQGVAAAAVVGSPWAAVGIGAEEAAQETVTWGGGAYLFGRFWSPVILEGELVSVADGRAVWRGTSLESGNRKAVKALPKEEQEKREVRLRLTARKAAINLVKKLEKKAWANLERAR